jgi:uncharacterized protein (DUF362 family)
MFGTIPDPLRIRYHENIHQVLSDLNMLFHGKMFVITDGGVCMEGAGPLYGEAKKLGILMFSDDPLANDLVAARIMKIPASVIKHLKLVEKWKGFGNNDVEVVTDMPIDSISDKPFKMSNRSLFVKVEGRLMRHPLIVKILFNDSFRRIVTKRIRFITDRLRGGRYKWYE